MKLFKFCIILILGTNCYAQKTQTVRVKIIDAQTMVGVESATVNIEKYSLNAIADKSGDAVFNNVPIGRLEIKVSSVGYATKLVKELLLESSKELILTINLEADSKNLNQITVTAASENTSGAIMGINTITSEQIFRLPATFFDPARLAFSFAGVANTNDQANGMSIRGNAPEALQWRLEGIEIVNPNHLSNAGTFSDQPTQTGGGTNILSAQLLGNMNFLSGTFPAGYGNALGGVMDMRFRVGNNNKHEHTVQIGLIGLDLSSEGPLNKNKKSSYLINYRYSFTGILGLMGVDFGGESIKFQDLAFNLNFPTKKLGTFMIFGMGGNSSNEFVPDSDQKNWTSEKDFNNIDFNSRMALVGVSHNIGLNNSWNIKTVIANSGLENLRSVYVTNPAVSTSSYNYQARNIISFSSILSGNILKNLGLKSGINVSHYFNEYNFNNKDKSFYSSDEFVLQPFLKFNNPSQSKINYNLGLQLAYYSKSKIAHIEPRAAFSYKLNDNLKLKTAYGLHSYQPQNRYAYEYKLMPIRSHHISVGAQYDLGTSDQFSTEIFYQGLFNLPFYGDVNQFASYLNGLENLNIKAQNFNETNKGRNFGIELNYKKLLNKGLFVIVNTTLYKSQFMIFDNSYYDTRFSGNHIVNLTLGKEWQRNKDKIIGVNTRIAWLGGFRNYEIDLLNSAKEQTTVYNYRKPLNVKNPDYFRPDLRVYFKKSRTKYARTISIDIQNAASYKNQAFDYYDTFLNKVVSKKQLGLIPMFNYRWEF
jgi:hypothetical protein